MPSPESKLYGSPKTVQISITGGALLVALIHLIWPSLSIDGVTLTLIGIAVLPWLAPLFRSVELPGGLKVEFKDLQEAEKRASEAGLLAASGDEEEYSFQLVADEDPNLALAGLRIELEKRLLDLAESRDLAPQRKGAGILMRELSDRGILTTRERAVLDDLIGLLNRAVHGADVDTESATWAMEVGPRLIRALEDKK